MNGKLLAKTGMIVPRIFLGPAVSTLEGKRQGWVVGCSLGSALSLLRDPHSPRYSSVLTYLLSLLRLRGGEQVMGMESGPQTWLHIRSKVRRDYFKNKRKVLEQHSPTHTHFWWSNWNLQDFSSHWGDSDASAVICEALWLPKPFLLFLLASLPFYISGLSLY